MRCLMRFLVKFSHVAIHFYDTDPQKFITFANKWHDKYQKPIVVTEIACQVSIGAYYAVRRAKFVVIELRRRQSS